MKEVNELLEKLAGAIKTCEQLIDEVKTKFDSRNDFKSQKLIIWIDEWKVNGKKIQTELIYISKKTSFINTGDNPSQAKLVQPDAKADVKIGLKGRLHFVECYQLAEKIIQTVNWLKLAISENKDINKIDLNFLAKLNSYRIETQEFLSKSGVKLYHFNQWSKRTEDTTETTEQPRFLIEPEIPADDKPDETDESKTENSTGMSQ